MDVVSGIRNGYECSDVNHHRLKSLYHASHFAQEHESISMGEKSFLSHTSCYGITSRALTENHAVKHEVLGLSSNRGPSSALGPPMARTDRGKLLDPAHFSSVLGAKADLKFR